MVRSMSAEGGHAGTGNMSTLRSENLIPRFDYLLRPVHVVTRSAFE